MPTFIHHIGHDVYVQQYNSDQGSFLFFVGDRKREDGLLVHYPGVSLQPKPST